MEELSIKLQAIKQEEFGGKATDNFSVAIKRRHSKTR